MFVYIIIILPYKIAFVEEGNKFFEVMDLLIDILFFMDILMSMLSAYYLNGVLVEDLKTLATQYVKSWFWFDLFSTFPYDYFVEMDASYLFLTKISKLLKILKLFRIARIKEQFTKNQISKKIFNYFRVGQQLSEFISFSLIIIVLTHVTGCFWFFLTKIYEQDTWYEHAILDGLISPNSSELEVYILSFYWAISTICTVGFGEVFPNNPLEKIFNLIWIMVGVAFYSYTVGTLSTILNNFNKKKSTISSRFAFLRELNEEKNIDKKLLEKITINLEYLEESNKYHTNKTHSNVLENIPLDLTYKLASHIYNDLITKVIIFKGLDIHFIAQMTPYFQARKYAVGETIYNQSQHASFIYFILNGKIGFF